MASEIHKKGLPGKEAEDLACLYLMENGMQLVQRNYRCRRGEIDLIMKQGQTTIFVEVRYRRSRRYGSAAESIDHRKRARLVTTALHYLQGHEKAARQPTRFDVVAIHTETGDHTIEWIQNAFQA